MKNDNSLEFWKGQVELGVKYLKEFSTFEEWSDNRKCYRHKFTSGLLPYNITYSTARTIVPSVYFANPHIMVSPRKMGVSREHAWIVSSVDNYLLEQCGIKQLMRRAVLDTFLCGLSPIRTGYDEAITRGLTTDEEIMDEVIKERDKPLNRTNYNIKIREEMPWAVNVRPEDVVFPWGTISDKDCPWIAQRIIRPLDDLKANKSFNTAGLEGTHIELQNQDTRKTFVTKGSAKLDLVEYWEISDYKRCERKAFVAGRDNWLLPPQPYSLLANGLDWEVLSFSDDSEYIYSTPEASIISPQQREINSCKTQEQMHRQIALLKFLIKKGAIKNLDQLLSATVGPAVEVEGDPKTVVELIQPHVPPDFEMMVRSKRDEVRELTGISQPASGQFTSGRKTATEVSVVHEGYSLRMGEKRDRVADVLKNIINKFNDIIFERWTNERVTEVLGEDGALYWVRYTPEEIKGDYDIKIDVDSLSPTTKTLKRREMMEMIGMMGKIPGANIHPIIEELSRDYGWSNVKELLPQAPETMGGAMGMREFQGLQGQMRASPSVKSERMRGYTGG